MDARPLNQLKQLYTYIGKQENLPTGPFKKKVVFQHPLVTSVLRTPGLFALKGNRSLLDIFFHFFQGAKKQMEATGNHGSDSQNGFGLLKEKRHPSRRTGITGKDVNRISFFPGGEEANGGIGQLASPRHGCCWETVFPFLLLLFKKMLPKPNVNQGEGCQPHRISESSSYLTNFGTGLELSGLAEEFSDPRTERAAGAGISGCGGGAGGVNRRAGDGAKRSCGMWQPRHIYRGTLRQTQASFCGNPGKRSYLRHPVVPSSCTNRLFFWWA